MTPYRFERLGFTYEREEKPTLQELTAELPLGKTTLLLGESGAGKTTLIEVLTHIAPEYHPGSVRGRFFCGDAPWETSSLKQMARHIGLVFQNSDSQFCTYTVEDELAFGLENLSVPPDKMEHLVENALAQLSITHLKDRPLHTLSGGEKQRVAIASVLILDPPLLIFDEPTSNLDPAGINEVFGIIDWLKTELGKTILIVEHQLEFLAARVDYLLALDRNGKLLFSGGIGKGLHFLMQQPNLNVHLPPSIEFFRHVQHKPSQPGLTPQAVAAYLQAKGSAPACLDEEESPPERENGPPVLACRSLEISLAGRAVLRGVDLDIHRGDFMAVVGPNGAGKTTLLHSLLNIYPGASGKVSLVGKSIKKLGRDKWNHAGIAFQNPELQFVAGSVQEEILYSLKKTKMTSAEKEDAARQTLEQFSLWEKRKLSPFVLSQGEKRRLSVAALLVRRQKLLMLDEPTFGQDLRNQNELMALMQALNQSGIAIVMVSHNMDLVYRYCNRVVLLSEGRIAFDGTPHCLFADENARVAGRLEQPFWLRVGQALPGKPNLRSAEDAVQVYSV